MISHPDIEERSLLLAREIVKRVDADPGRHGLDDARRRCQRWLQEAPCADLSEWALLLEKPWPDVRQTLLDPSEKGRRLRQSNPFCGILSPRERWTLYRKWRHDTHPA